MHSSLCDYFAAFRGLSRDPRYGQREFVYTHVSAEHDEDVLESANLLRMQSLFNRVVDRGAKLGAQSGPRHSLDGDWRFQQPSTGFGSPHCLTLRGAVVNLDIGDCVAGTMAAGSNAHLAAGTGPQGDCIRAIHAGEIDVPASLKSENMLTDAAHHALFRVTLHRSSSSVKELMSTTPSVRARATSKDSPRLTPMAAYKAQAGEAADKCPGCLEARDTMAHWLWECQSPHAVLQRQAVDAATAEAMARVGNDFWFAPTWRLGPADDAELTPLRVGDWLGDAVSPPPPEIDLVELHTLVDNGELSDQSRKMVSRLIELDSGGHVQSGLGPGRAGSGRLSGGLTVHSLPVEVRARVCPAYHIISIPLSRPTLILNLVREGLRHEMPTAYTEALTAVVEDTDGVHRSIASHYGCNRHAATELISTIARGEQRPWPAWSEEVGFNVLSDRHLQMVCSYAGAVGVAAEALPRQADLDEVYRRSPGRTSAWHKHEALSILCERIMSQVVNTMALFLQGQGFDPQHFVTINDGIMVRKSDGGRCDTDMLIAMQNQVRDTHNIGVRIVLESDQPGTQVQTPPPNMGLLLGQVTSQLEPPNAATSPARRYEQQPDGRMGAFGEDRGPGTLPSLLASVSRLRILREHHAPSCDAGHDVDLLNAASGNFVKGAVTLLQPTTSRVIRPPPALVYWVADVWGLEQEVLTSAATMCGPGLFPLPPRLALNTLVTAMVPEGFRLETDHPLYDRDTPFTRPSMGYADQCDMHFKHTWKKAVVTAKRGHRVVLWVTVGGKGAEGRDLGAGGEGVDVRRVLHFPKGALPAGPRVACRAKHRRPNGPSTAEAWTATRVDRQHTVQGPAERSDMADHRLVMSPTDKATDVWLFEPSASAEDPPQSQLTALSLAVAGTCCPLPPRGTTHDVMFYTRRGAAINLALRHCPPGAEVEGKQQRSMDL